MNTHDAQSEIASAEYVIIGGGAVGCGVAYSLAKAGKTDVLLLEKGPTLASATTSQAAGLVGQVRGSVERVQLAMWSVKTFDELAQDEKANPGWRKVGSLRVAMTEARVAEFEKLKAIADEAGLEVHFIKAAEAKSKWPAMDFETAKAVLWCPSDGYLQPSDLTMAYSVHARRAGARFMTGTTVEDITVENGAVTGVVTNRGAIRCGTVINAAGAHAYHVAKLVGIELPIVPVRHEFFVTVHCPGLDPSLPVVRSPDGYLYARAEVNSLLCGGFEPECLSTDPRRYQLLADPPPLDEPWEVLSQFAENLVPLMPQVGELGIRSVFKGWPTFTPDGHFIVGPCEQVQGFVMAGGCNAHGVSGSAGIGRHVVESLLEKEPSPYVASLSPNRFTEGNWSWDTAQRESQAVGENYYSIGS